MLTILNNIKLAAHNTFFLLDRLRSNKLLELHCTERRISSIGSQAIQQEKKHCVQQTLINLMKKNYYI